MLINEPNTHGETVRFVDNDLYFEKTGITVKYGHPYVKLVKSSRMSTGGNKLTMVNRENGVALPYTKEIILRNLLEESLANGVDILTETAGIRAENIDGKVKVTIRDNHTRTLKEVWCRCCFAADGCNSQIVTGLDLF